MTSPNDNWHAPAWFKGSELELRALLEAMDHGDGTNKRTTRNKAEWALLTKVFEDYDAAISKSEDKLIAQLETKAKINDLVAQFVVRDKAAFKRFLQRLRQLKIPFTRLTEADEYDVEADLQQLRLRSEEATQARAESLAHMADEKSPTRGHELKTKRFFGHDDVLALMVMVGWTPESPVGSRSKKKAFKNADAEEDEGAAAAEEREGSPDPHRPSAVAEFLFVRQAWMYFFEFVESSRSTPGRCEKYFPGGKFPDWFPSAEYFDSA